MTSHLIVALKTRLNEEEMGSLDQRPKPRRRTDSSNSEEDANSERTQVTQASPLPVAALTPVSIELPPWSALMSRFLASAVTMKPVGEGVSQAMIHAGLERAPGALHLTAITCSDL
jgi:hypothetical protein